MILPGLRIKWINDEKGYGLFATQTIPKGTVTFVQDDLDIVIPSDQILSPQLAPLVERFSYDSPDGSRIISWDFGKYMNHCCFANTLTTGYGFEIAVRDINPGEEVTDDYRIFTREHHLLMSCELKDCPRTLEVGNTRQLVQKWDREILEALLQFKKVKQDLRKFIPRNIIRELNEYLSGKTKYKSVRSQMPQAVAVKRKKRAVCV